MSQKPFSRDPNYLFSIQGLHQLHALTAAGKDQTPEADELRDTLDHPWMCLSETETDRINGLSEDLYSLSDPPQPVLPMNSDAERELDEVPKAMESGEWDEALTLLRRSSRYVDPADLSRRRGTIWLQAGDRSTAALFFEHASRIEPE
jgi:hypothetical protein